MTSLMEFYLNDTSSTTNNEHLRSAAAQKNRIHEDCCAVGPANSFMLFAPIMEESCWMLLVLTTLPLLLLLLQPQPGSSFSTPSPPPTFTNSCKHHFHHGHQHHHLKHPPSQQRSPANSRPLSNSQTEDLFSWRLFNTEGHGHGDKDEDSSQNDIIVDDPIHDEIKSASRTKKNEDDACCLSTKRREFMTIFAAAASSSMTLLLTTSTSSHAESSAVLAAAESMSSSVTTAEAAATLNKYAMAPLAFSSVRRYRQVMLSNNGLRVLLVSDKSSSSSDSSTSSSNQYAPLQQQQQQQVALIIQGAGQFADPLDLPGCAHLMEHLCLSSASISSSSRRGLRLVDSLLQPPPQEDFEDWLADRDGSSNGYTAYDHVCFHFSCPISSSVDASSSSVAALNSGSGVFQEALERFAVLFEARNVERVCASAEVVKREVRRVNSELDFDTVAAQAYYLTKDFVNPEHPFSKFSHGSYDTLERIPKEHQQQQQLAQQQQPLQLAQQRPMTVGQRQWDFFQRHYQGQQATLVVIGPQDLRTLERWVAPFATILTSKPQQDAVFMPPFSMFTPADGIGRNNDEYDDDDDDDLRRLLSRTGRRPRVAPSYPGGFLQGTRLKTLVLYRKPQPGDKEEEETLTFQWILNLDYSIMPKQQQQLKTRTPRAAAVPTQKAKTTNSATTIVTGTHMAFFLSQIFSRKLYVFLQRRGWVSAKNAFPRVTLPVDVSAFQLVKLEIRLTKDGFLNRPAVVAAVFDVLDALFTTTGFSSGKKFVISRELVSQWMSMAKLHGYTLASRPSDAVELALDALVYDQDDLYGDGLFMGGRGRGGQGVVDASDYWGSWYRFPSPEDRSGVTLLRNHLEDTLSVMRDPNNVVVICTAGNRAITKSSLSMPLSTRDTWKREPVTGARFMFDDMFRFTTSRVEKLVLSRLVNREELLYPILNPLIPIILRPAREANEEMTRSKLVSPKTAFITLYSTIQEEIEGRRSSALDFWMSQPSKKTMREESNWSILKLKDEEGLPLPRSPPEPSCRSVFVLQFLSSRPARAGLRQAAQGELWRVSFDFDKSVVDLAELGAAAGCFYDLSFNKFGCRLAFLGLSQNLQSYARRLSRRLVEHQSNLLAGQEMFQREVTTAAVANARRARGVSQQRRRRIVSSIRQSTAYEAAAEGIAFLRSCKGAVCFSQGDLLPMETEELVQDLRKIFANVVGGELHKSMPAYPSLEDIIYLHTWKPRNASPCFIPGVPLISDACGRVRR
jgi:insulysin